MNEQAYHWTLDSAVWQIQNGLSGSRTDSAHTWIKDKIENGSVSEVQAIAEKLFDTVAALIGK